MTGNKITSMWFVAIWLMAIAATTVHAVQGEEQTALKFQWLPKTFSGLERDAGVVAKAVGFKTWPQTEVRYVAPQIDKTLLSKPGWVTRETSTYGCVPFQQVPGGESWWDWSKIVKTDEPLPTEIPPERKVKLLEHLSPEKRNDPNFLKEYLQRKLDRYRRLKKYRLDGMVDVKLCAAPSCRAAQEYMLALMTASNMLPSAIASSYHKGPQGLGTVSFVTASNQRVDFVRDNIFVEIRADGCFAEEALSLAHKIDAMIIKQPALTYQQLLARRPSIMIAANAVKSTTDDHFTGLYNVSAPKGTEIVSVKAYVDGQKTWTKDGKIYIVDKKGKVKVELTATTSELLTNTFEREVIIPDEEQDSQS